jgi:hypothetical protein
MACAAEFIEAEEEEFTGVGAHMTQKQMVGVTSVKE